MVYIRIYIYILYIFIYICYIYVIYKYLYIHIYNPKRDNSWILQFLKKETKAFLILKNDMLFTLLMKVAIAE